VHPRSDAPLALYSMLRSLLILALSISSVGAIAANPIFTPELGRAIAFQD